MQALSQEEWAEVMARFVNHLGKAVGDTYDKLFKESEDVSTPVRAEPLASLLADGIMGLLAAYNTLNAKEAQNMKGVEQFDIIGLFTQEMFTRLTELGYTTIIDGQADPEAYKKAVDAMDIANTPSEGSTKH